MKSRTKNFIGILDFKSHFFRLKCSESDFFEMLADVAVKASQFMGGCVNWLCELNALAPTRAPTLLCSYVLRIK